jgi:hypothetical protein
MTGLATGSGLVRPVHAYNENMHGHVVGGTKDQAATVSTMQCSWAPAKMHMGMSCQT